MNLNDKTLKELFALADEIGKKRYHKLTHQDFEDYRKYDYWRYVGGDGECGVTQASKDWVKENSEFDCPICERRYSLGNGRSIDHKLPRSQYPWLSMEFKNLWVICLLCNKEKGERHWYEYERYMLTNHPDLYAAVRMARPLQVLQSLKD